MRIIVVVPSRPPIIIVWINDIIPLWAFDMAIRKDQIGPVIVAVARSLIMCAQGFCLSRLPVDLY